MSQFYPGASQLPKGEAGAKEVFSEQVRRLHFFPKPLRPMGGPDFTVRLFFWGAGIRDRVPNNGVLPWRGFSLGFCATIRAMPRTEFSMTWGCCRHVAPGGLARREGPKPYMSA